MSALTLAALVREAALPHVGPDRTPGLVALVAHGDEVHVEVLGELSIGGPPVERESFFRIASVSKPITAAALLTLVDEGLLKLDDPVESWLPELADRRVLVRMDGPLEQTVPAARSITVRDLLTFTFGFGASLDMFTAPSPWPIFEADAELQLASLGPPQPDVQPDPDTWIQRLGSLPLMAQPGERWLYNTGAQVLSVLIARVTGDSFPHVLQERLLRPLGMSDTSFVAIHPGRLATGYRNTAEGLVVFDSPGGLWSQPHAFPDGASGLVSTVDDLYAFSRMLLSGGGDGLLSPESVREMTSDQLTPEQKRRSGGLGPDFFAETSWGFCQAVYANGSYGWNGGLGASWRVDPQYGLVVIVLTQRMFDSPDPPQVHKDILAAAYRAVGA